MDVGFLAYKVHSKFIKHGQTTMFLQSCRIAIQIPECQQQIKLCCPNKKDLQTVRNIHSVDLSYAIIIIGLAKTLLVDKKYNLMGYI